MSEVFVEGIRITFIPQEAVEVDVSVFEFSQLLLCLQKLVNKAVFALEVGDAGFQAISAEQRQHAELLFNITRPVINEVHLKGGDPSSETRQALRCLFSALQAIEQGGPLHTIPTYFESQADWVQFLSRLYTEFVSFYKWVGRIGITCALEFDFMVAGISHRIKASELGEASIRKLGLVKVTGSPNRYDGKVMGTIKADSLLISVPGMGLVNCRMPADILAKHRTRLIPDVRVEIRGVEIIDFGAKSSAPPSVEVSDIQYL